MEVISSDNFKKNYNCDNLKFHSVYELPNSCKLYYKYLFQLNANKKKFGKMISQKYLDYKFLNFCNCCKYPILDEDSRKLIYNIYTYQNRKIACLLIMYYYRKWKIKNFYSNFCSKFLNRVGLFY